MELTETIDRLNERLRETYGVDTVTGHAIYRIVWSEDQFEKRLSDYTKEGLKLLTPQLVEVPKYRQWCKERYILERLSFVESNSENNQMTIAKLSYEPLWTFMDNQMNYLPPKWEVCQIVIDTVHAALYNDSSLAKYKETNDDIAEEQRNSVAKIQDELFGNETEVGDALAHKEAIIVPRNYDKEVH